MARLPYLLASSLAVLAACALVACASAPPDDPPRAELVTGTFTRTPIEPSASSWGGSWGSVFSAVPEWHHQWVFSGRSGMSENVVGGSGWITALEFFPYSATTVSGFNCPDVSIHIGPTWLTTLTTAFASNVEQGRGSMVAALTHKPVTIPTTGPGTPSFVITLDEPVYYDEIDRLVIELFRYAACTGTKDLRYDDRPTLSATAAYALSATAATGVLDLPPAMRLHFRGGTTWARAGDAYDGTDDSAITPGGVGRMQALIRAEDIAGRGAIVGLAFDATADWGFTPQTLTTVSVKLANVPATTALGTSFAGNLASASGAVTVARDLNLHVPGPGRFWIPFNAGAFTYDGTSNLLMDVTVLGATGPMDVRYAAIPGNRILRSADPAAATGALYTRSFEPTFRFAGAPVTLAAVDPSLAGISGEVLGGGMIQSLYDAGRLGTGGAITKLSVRLMSSASSSATTVGDLKIYMGTTSKLRYSEYDHFESNMDGETLVYSGALRIPGGLHQGDWLEIPLQTSFSYDPSKSLVILFASNDAAGPFAELGGELQMRSVGLRRGSPVALTEIPDFCRAGAVSVRLGMQQ